jgi:hypothetical protein
VDRGHVTHGLLPDSRRYPAGGCERKPSVSEPARPGSDPRFSGHSKFMILFVSVIAREFIAGYARCVRHEIRLSGSAAGRAPGNGRDRGGLGANRASRSDEAGRSSNGDRRGDKTAAGAGFAAPSQARPPRICPCVAANAHAACRRRPAVRCRRVTHGVERQHDPRDHVGRTQYRASPPTRVKPSRLPTSVVPALIAYSS